MMLRFLLLFTFFLTAQLSFAVPAKMIGTSALSKKIFNRIFLSQTPDKSWTLPDLYFFTEPPISFVEQMGFYDAASFEIKNGDPNPFNMILISLLAHNIAEQLSQSCSPLPATITTPPSLHDPLKKVLMQLCLWPSPQALDQSVISDFFHQITGFDFSASEKEVWMNYVQSSSFLQKNSSQAIYEMTYTLFMNPYFLLKK